MSELGTKPFWAKCPGCGHCWAAAYLPMEMHLAAKLLMAARCPMGCAEPVGIAKQDDGVLQEPNAEHFTRIATDGGNNVAGA